MEALLEAPTLLSSQEYAHPISQGVLVSFKDKMFAV